MEDTYKGQVDNPLTLNRYTYVSNAPLKFVDPSGHGQVIAGDGNPGTPYYYDNEGVRRIHGTKEIDWKYYREWFESDQAGMQETLRGTNKVKNFIAAKVTWDWAMENGVPMDGGDARYSAKVSGVKLNTKNTITNTAKGTGNALQNIKGLDDILNDPSKLKGIEPDDLHKYLIDNGYNPQPLSNGSLKGKTFEDGGGFKVNWGGDRILQYHPGSRHHGDIPYFKLSSGKTGTQRYDMQGNLIK
ncbi:hypothetical protein [Brevibacillus parabrevis]|uniref:hypothetical protein n=1 Tax=Brevibacillus parabrevis TaxID=54914 RepID=UPI001F61151A|nr:hypothetical protein [Brevibacillus parabrevis]MDR5002780.1 hypothetical protein [Brevibacillus parabrevis]